MNFDITKEQKQLRREVITFAKENLNNKEYLEKFSAEMFEKIANFGLLGITIDEEYGGLGEDYLTAAITFEALGYACENNGLVFVVNNHIWVCQNLINIYGNEELKKKYLFDMVQGKKIGAIAITEAESGSDAMSMHTTAKEDCDYYILNGSKMFISNGPIADVFVVYAVTEETPCKKYTAFVVEKSFEGIKIGSNIEKMGLGACPTCEVVFDNCKVPKQNVLGTVNNAGIIMTMALEWERLFEFVPHIGVMQRIMERCIEQANVRKQFGKNIGENQSVSNKIADMRMSIEMSRLLMYKIACLKDSNKSAYLETSIFKLFVSEAYIKTCRDAMQIFGAYGYSKEYGLERELRDALACSIYSGTNEIQKNTIYNIVSSQII